MDITVEHLSLAALADVFPLRKADAVMCSFCPATPVGRFGVRPKSEEDFSGLVIGQWPVEGERLLLSWMVDAGKVGVRTRNEKTIGKTFTKFKMTDVTRNIDDVFFLIWNG